VSVICWPLVVIENGDAGVAITPVGKSVTITLIVWLKPPVAITDRETVAV
jgi:hypothetical protein